MFMPALNPEIFEWARKTAGLSLDEAAHAIDLKEARGVSARERLAAFETGKDEPSRPLLLRMAKAYRRSLLVFYLERPPRIGDRGKDFRTLPGGEPPLYNPVLDALIRDITARQSVIRELLKESEAEPLPFVGSATMDIAVPALAERIARQIGFDLGEFRHKDSVDDAFGYLRFKVEDAGIFVLLLGNLGSHHTNIAVDTFRGFAMADAIAPIAIINDNDAKSAWSFTALHEVVHLWLGDTGVSGWATELAAERYCSDVAAEILLPHGELDELARIGRLSFDKVFEAVSKFAGKRKISRAMVAYRVFRNGLIGHKTWGELKERFRQDWLVHKEREALKQANREGGPSYYVVRRHRIGRALLDLAQRSLGEGQLTYTKAGQILGVRARNVEPLLAVEFPRRGSK